jgi:hypothetical protein
MSERDKTIAILTAIASGVDPWTLPGYLPSIAIADVVAAAEHALRLVFAEAEETPKPAGSDRESHLRSLRGRYPRAYEAWTDEETESLLMLSKAGHDEAAIAERLGRQPSAIASRLRRYQG